MYIEHSMELKVFGKNVIVKHLATALNIQQKKFQSNSICLQLLIQNDRMEIIQGKRNYCSSWYICCNINEFQSWNVKTEHFLQRWSIEKKKARGNKQLDEFFGNMWRFTWSIFGCNCNRLNRNRLLFKFSSVLDFTQFKSDPFRCIK